jgi:hypothetical protein
MPPPRRVVCGQHGETPAAFTCRHVAFGVACGYHVSPDDAHLPWPDAWCDACAEVLARVGAWNAESERFADIKALCTHCYEAARARNRAIPPLTRGRRTRLSAREQAELLHHAFHFAQDRQVESNARWGWHDRPRYEISPETETIRFCGRGYVTVVADVQFIGSFSTRTDTFQWSWETMGETPATEDARLLRGFGEVRGIERLVTANWPGEEYDGWEMVSLACYLRRTDGIYRVPYRHQLDPDEHLYWFITLRNWRMQS